LPFTEDVAVKNTLSLIRGRWPGAVTDSWDLSPRRFLAAALVGELLAAVYLFASGNVSPVLVSSLQLFLRF
jgi:hypothetical protein